MWDENGGIEETERVTVMKRKWERRSEREWRKMRITLSSYLPLLVYNLLVAPMLFGCANTCQFPSFCVTLSRSLSHSLSHFLFISVTLSVSSFPPFSPHTIPLLFSIQVRSFTGCPFSDEFDEDNQMAKDHTIAYGIWKTNPSYIHLQNHYLTLSSNMPFISQRSLHIATFPHFRLF